MNVDVFDHLSDRRTVLTWDGVVGTTKFLTTAHLSCDHSDGVVGLLSLIGRHRPLLTRVEYVPQFD